MEIEPRKEFTPKSKRIIYNRANGLCQHCSVALGFREGDYDHIKPCAMGGSNHHSNGQLLCKPCHLIKTKEDRRIIAKTKRVHKKHTGQVTRKKKEIQSRPFQKRDREPRIEKQPVAWKHRLYERE